MKLSRLGIGRKVYESRSGMLFRVAAQDHYGPGITTLLSEHVIAVRALDGTEVSPKPEPLYEQSGVFGSNLYPLSNLHQWLNSCKRDWYQPAHARDNPPSAAYLRYGEYPYDQKPGFLCRFSEAFLGHLAVTQIPVIVRTARGTGRLATVDAAVFLPSRTEMNKGNEIGIPEGRPLPIFYDHYIFKATPSQDQIEKYGRRWNPEEPEKGLFFDQAQMYDPKFGWWYYMRTPNVLYSFLQRIMTPYGSVSYTYANNDIAGIRPLINLSGDTSVLDVGIEEMLFRID